jgi:hypothetical protein
MRGMFAQLPDAQLPEGFDAKVMKKVYAGVAMRKSRRKLLEALAYTFGAAAMAAVCIILIKVLNVPTGFESFEWSIFKVPRLDFMNSPSFSLSIYAGSLALLLLLVDSGIRRTLHNSKK